MKPFLKTLLLFSQYYPVAKITTDKGIAIAASTPENVRYAKTLSIYEDTGAIYERRIDVYHDGGYQFINIDHQGRDTFRSAIQYIPSRSHWV